jgi:hypothetical protein
MSTMGLEDVADYLEQIVPRKIEAPRATFAPNKSVGYLIGATVTASVVLLAMPSRATDLNRSRDAPATEREHVRPTETEIQWYRYLDGLPTVDSSICGAHIEKVKELWHALRRMIGVQIPVPTTAVTSDGAIELAWDNGEEYIDVDVLPDGAVHWYYRHRGKGTTDGTSEEPDPSLSHSVADIIAAVASR